MKNKNHLIIFFLVFFGANTICLCNEIQEKSSAEEQVTVYCTPDLKELTTAWTEEFNKLNQGVQLNFITTENSNLIKMMEDNSAVGIISEHHLQTENYINNWHVVVARDIIVPVLNKNNSLIAKIQKQGISPAELGFVLSNIENRNWMYLLKDVESTPLKFYMYNNSEVDAKIAEFISLKKEQINGTKVSNAKEMLTHIQKEKNAIGFCKLSDVLDAENKLIYENIALLPIDKNGNGQMDYMEQIYDNPNNFARGVWIGKYPHALVSNIYAVSQNVSLTEPQEVFLNWILDNGQNNLHENGYSKLVSSELKSKQDLIAFDVYETGLEKSKYADLKVIFLIVGLIVLIGLLIDFALFRWNRIKLKERKTYEKQPFFSDNSLDAPAGLFFDKSHTWAFLEKNGQVKIGLNDFLPSVTGYLTGVKMKKTGDSIIKGELLFSIIQEGKQLNIMAPVSGIIKALNTNLEFDASLLNYSPYDEGWVYMVEPSNWLREIEFLLRVDKFKSWISSEYLRLKDFFAHINQLDKTLQPLTILQEGGEIKKCLLKEFDPEVWEEFQIHFIESNS